MASKKILASTPAAGNESFSSNGESRYPVITCYPTDPRVQKLGGIETAIYYPRPIPAQTLYRDLGYGCDFAVASRLSREVLSLPVHPALRRQDLDAVIAAVNAWAESKPGTAKVRSPLPRE